MGDSWLVDADCTGAGIETMQWVIMSEDNLESHGARDGALIAPIAIGQL
jgi:hypothetical protein